MENIFTSVLNNALTASYLILAVVLFRFIFKKVPRYIICIMWGLVALKLIIPFSIESSMSLLPEKAPYNIAETLEEKKPAENIETPESTPSKETKPLQGVTMPDSEIQSTIPSYTPNTEIKEDAPTPPVSEEIHTPSVESTEVKEEAYTPSVEVTEEREEAPIPSVENTEAKTEAPALPDTNAVWAQDGKSISLMVVLSIIWLSVAGLLVVWSIVSYIRLRFIMTESVKLEGNVYLSDRCPTPFVMGFLKAKIYLPSDVNKEDIPYILAHERRHIKRLDHITKAISYLIFAFFWFNPLVLIAHILYSRDIELACDEAVVKKMSIEEKKAYSTALLSCSMPKHLIAACPIAFGEVGVKSRIKSVLNYKKPSFWLIIVAVITAVVIAVTLMTSPKKTAPKPTPDKQSEEKVEEKEENPEEKPEEDPKGKPESEISGIEVEIPFPDEEFLNLHGEYVVPNFVSHEEFEWGDYYPLVQFEVANFATESATVDYAVLSEKSSDLIGARKEYDKLNTKYLIEQKPSDVAAYESFISNYPIITDDSEVYDFFFKSRIVGTSEDLSTVMRLSYFAVDESANSVLWAGSPWYTKYETIKDGKVIYDRVAEDFCGSSWTYFEENYNYEYMSKLHSAYNENYRMYYVDSDDENYYVIDIYSFPDKERIYRVAVPSDKKYTEGNVETICDVCVDGYIDGGYLLLTHRYYEIATDKEEWEDGYITNSRSALYLYALSTGEMTWLENHAYNPMLSPDGKYLVYTSHAMDVIPGIVPQEQEKGFYVKNLEDGTTVFYPHIYENNYRELYIKNWIQREKFNKEVYLSNVTDENTVKLEIKFPSDFSTQPYTTPNIVSHEEFEWGTYVPFVKYKDLNYERHLSYSDFGIITSDCTELAQSNIVYKKLNEKFLVEHDTIDAPYNPGDTVTVNGDETLKNFLFKSRVIYISEEADKIGNYQLIHEEWGDDTKSLANSFWWERYDIIKNGIVSRSFAYDKMVICENPDWLSSSFGLYTKFAREYNYVDEYTFDYTYPDVKKPEFVSELVGEIYDEYYDDEVYVYSLASRFHTSDEKEKHLYVWSQKKNRLMYDITVPYGFKVEQCIDSRYLLFIVDKLIYQNDVFYDACFHSYLYDMQENKLTHLENYTYRPRLSPDMKYLAYTSNFGGSIGYDIGEISPTGFYIKNLEDGTTLFFEHDDYFGVINWVNEEKLLALINDVEFVPEITEPFSSILSSKNSFLLNNENRTFIKDFVFPYSGKGLMEDTSVQYTYVDFEGDGNNELVIRGRYGEMLILKANGNSYYGFTYDFRSMQTLYDDGTFAWNYTDAEGLHYGRAKLEFSDGAYKVTELCRTDWHKETGKHYFYVGDTEVDSYGLVMYEGNYSNQEAVFYSLNDNAEIVLDFDHQSDSVTLTYAPRNQSIFPISFEYDGKKITVNEPIFTGIPTNSVYSYKDHYAFENGINVFEISLESGYKYVAVNKEGKIVDTDHSESHISDVSAIITREDLAMHMTGVPGNYKQQLLGGPGSTESEKFDVIGYFYNGIAPVIRDGKIGFVGANCKTLLEPCIEIDDLRYPPDYKGYWCYFLTEDAIVLPIDGEFAIINLTREDIPEIREPFWSVLKGDTPMNSGEKEVYFTDMYDYDSKKFIDKSLKYAFVDMNSDGKKELLVQGIDTVILSDMGDGVLGFAVNFRALAGVDEDGTFGWNDMAFDGLHYGVSKYNTDWTVTELFSIHDDSENNVTRYFIGAKEVTKAEYDENESKYSTNSITFYTLDYEKLK